MDKDLYHPYMNENGKIVHGAASLNHYIFTEKGGLINYHDEIGEAYVKAFIKNVSAEVNADLAKKSKAETFQSCFLKIIREELPALPLFYIQFNPSYQQK